MNNDADMIEMLRAVHANANTFAPVLYDDQQHAVEDVRNDEVQGAIVIPPEFSRRVLTRNDPHVAIIEDNTDNFVSATLVAATASGPYTM